MQSQEVGLAIIEQKIPILGLALIASLIFGKFSKKLKIPKVTAFIFTGILLGPTGINLLSTKLADSIHFLSDIAMGLILFNIGGDFDRDLIKKLGGKSIKEIATAGAFTFILVFSLTFVSYSLITKDFQLALIISIFLSFVSLECAPPTTLLVMKEYNAKGPLQRSILTYLGLATVVALIGTQVIEVVLKVLHIWPNESSSTPLIQLGMLVWSLLGSVILGFLLGFFLSYWEQKEKKSSEFLMLVGSTILFGQTLSYYLKTDPLIISTVIGFTVVNASNSGKEIHKGINEMGLSIYAIFFVLAGVHINLREFTPTVLLMAVVYIVCRTAGFYFGSKITGKVVSSFESKSKYFGLCTLSHAGIALAIVTKIMPIETQSAQLIVTIIMSSIFVFEIMGPLLLKHNLVLAGEIKETTAGGKSFTKKADLSVGQIIDNLQENLNIKSSEESLIDTTIKSLVKTDITSVKVSANIENVEKFVYQNSSPFYSIIDDDQTFLGVIDLKQLVEISKEEDNSFITAKSLISEYPVIYHDMSRNEALAVFQEHLYQSLPVVNRTTRKILGIINQKDLLKDISDNSPSEIIN
ncbi:cation:proton antiporter [Halobacteriovorax sp. HLS]|uniref:cation:proton antiporter domain-containing protein n=1 Tax=Halobacteriovorax sp. HLS TaxID=2234000 RepID=UPI000FD93F31|nr:cation:proton antiporter [Halobacteriovorax sp. HLS]